MADRKQTPDVLGEILGEVAAVEAPSMRPSSQPSARSTTGAPVRRRSPARAEVRHWPWEGMGEPAAEPAGRTQWEHQVVSFQNYRGWRPRYINGQEMADWTAGPLLHDFLNQMGQEGWEVAGAGSGHPLYGSSDQHQVIFKRKIL